MCKKADANREYKDNVFRLLFGDESKSAELYNAIKGTKYSPSAVIINTLQNPLFVDLRNDISFTVGGKFVILIEHQSSVNPNMGLRLLMYITRVYETLINKDEMYKSKPMSIENPEFYVMYNGTDDYPEKSIIKLSDLFKVQGVKNNLELTVTVYNVNKGYNNNIMKRSKTLDEYSAFITKVRNYKENSGLELAKAIKKAVDDCIKNNILREFLEKYGGDVVSILSREFNLDDAKRVWTEETREDTKEEIAKKLLDILDIKTIAEKTSLPIEKVRQLKDAQNRKQKNVKS